MALFRMFIDDTGLVTQLVSEHPQQRYASITGVILEWDYLTNKFDPDFIDLKRKHFGVDSNDQTHVLHLRKIKKCDGPFQVLSIPEKRDAWEKACLSMYERAKFHVITVCIDKLQYRERYPDSEKSFYQMLVGNAIERYYYFLRGNGTGDVMAEATNQSLDAELKRLYRRFYESGSDHISAERLQSVLTSKEIKIKEKKENIPGLQLADLLASPCFAHCKAVYTGCDPAKGYSGKVGAAIEQHRFYRDHSGNPHRYGRVWRP